MIERIAECLVEDHVELMRENAELRAERDPVKQEPVDGLARACNLAGLDYEDFLRIKAYLPVAVPVDAKAIRAEALEEAAEYVDRNLYTAGEYAEKLRERAAAIRGLK